MVSDKLQRDRGFLQKETTCDDGTYGIGKVSRLIAMKSELDGTNYF